MIYLKKGNKEINKYAKNKNGKNIKSPTLTF